MMVKMAGEGIGTWIFVLLAYTCMIGSLQIGHAKVVLNLTTNYNIFSLMYR